MPDREVADGLTETALSRPVECQPEIRRRDTPALPWLPLPVSWLQALPWSTRSGEDEHECLHVFLRSRACVASFVDHDQQFFKLVFLTV
jgi:hypothetical protein